MNKKNANKRQKLCKICQSEIIDYRRGKVKTCSRECSQENKCKIDIKNNRKRHIKKLKICSLCNKWFCRRVGGSKYCLNCYTEGRKKNRRVNDRKSRWKEAESTITQYELKKIRGWGDGTKSFLFTNCLYCNQKFRKLGNSRCCSLICRRQLNYQKAKNLRRTVKHEQKGICQICNQIFKFKDKRTDITVCSDNCWLEKKRKISRKWAKKQRIVKNESYKQLEKNLKGGMQNE